MNTLERRLLRAVLLATASLLLTATPAQVARNEALLQQLRQAHQLSDQQVERIRAILAGSAVIGQGNPAVSQHPQTPEQCRSRLAQRSIQYGNPEFERVCGGPHMAPLYDPRNDVPSSAKACIDQFEFPDIPCEYPVVWVKAREAAQICEAMGKRLCDAHEWEGACAGSLEPPDYRFELARGTSPDAGIRRMREAHNRAYEGHHSWSYGPAYRTGVCGTGSFKTPGCEGGQWGTCGSNTYPAGAFADCRSGLGVYDLNGNAAEHMNLPLSPSQMASQGSRELGYTEMKGSWFVFDAYRAHEDACRWRAPFWHGTRVMDPHSHANYHLGFRCCKTVGQ